MILFRCASTTKMRFYWENSFNMLGRQLLWLACRHHILEILLKISFHELLGDTSGPEDCFFKFMKPKWNSLNLRNITSPQIPNLYKQDVTELLTFIETCLKPQNNHLTPRDDYREFLELAKLVLGGSVQRKRGHVYRTQRPGADHHARWMSKAINVLKLTLLRKGRFPTLPNFRRNWRDGLLYRFRIFEVVIYGSLVV